MTRPALVALARAIIEAAVLAVIGALIVALTEIDGGQLAPWAPIAVLALRQLEGIADERIDPSKARGTLGRTLAGTTAVNGTTGIRPGDRGQSTRAIAVTALVIAVIVLILVL